MATATRLGRASEHVQGVAVVVMIIRAKWERERRTRACWRVVVLRRPVSCQGALTACLACHGMVLGMRVLDNCVCLLA
jgi:hypothetical protein